MRTIQDSDVVQFDAFIPQFENPLCHKLRLLATVIQRDHGRLRRGRFACRLEIFLKLVNVRGDGRWKTSP